jgi:hypothetical protein
VNVKVSFPGPHATCRLEPRADASAAASRDASPGSACDASTAAEADTSHLQASDASRPPCAWCRGPIPAGARRDSVCCSKRCRQARHRFGRAAGRALAAAAVVPLRLAYADPPYPGKAHLYRGHPDYAGEVDHIMLIARLAAYDGWALSTSAAALPSVLALCPPDVRIAAWHRGPRVASSWQPLAAWEPVIYIPGRPVDPARGTRPDSLVHGVAAMTTLSGPGRPVSRLRRGYSGMGDLHGKCVERGYKRPPQAEVLATAQLIAVRLGQLGSAGRRAARDRGDDLADAAGPPAGTLPQISSPF